jgi:hypothetical protein
MPISDINKLFNALFKTRKNAATQAFDTGHKKKQSIKKTNIHFFASLFFVTKKHSAYACYWLSNLV